MTFQNWLLAFALTQLFEMPVYIMVFRDRTWKERILFSFGASAITHPLVWGVFLWRDLPFEFTFVMAETFAVFAEALYLQLLGIRRGLYWSLVANVTSMTLGQFYYFFANYQFHPLKIWKALFG